MSNGLIPYNNEDDEEFEEENEFEEYESEEDALKEFYGEFAARQKWTAVLKPTPEQVNGIILFLDSDHVDFVVETLDVWFDGVEEMSLVATSEKQYSGQGFIILEWRGYAVDPYLVTVIKIETQVIQDYALYSYGKE